MNRKNFMEKIGASVATLVLFPWLQSCSDKAKSEVSGNKARIGIIGTGSRGCFHINNLLGIQFAEITALCDVYKPHLDNASAVCPKAKLYSDYRKLLEDDNVDGVIICTPLHLHAQMSIDTLDAGKHLFCEKSMAYSMEECKRMYDKWKEGDRVMLIGQQRLFDPKYVKAMEIIHSGAIGDVVGVRNYWYRNNDWRREVPETGLERHINWRLYNEYSRGLMTELACHQIQNGAWAMNLLPEMVMGCGSINFWKDGREVFDNLATIYTFPNKVHMTCDYIISNKHFGMGEQILCSKGTIDLVSGLLYYEDSQLNPKRSGIEQLIAQIEQGFFSNSVFAGTSWAAETASKDVGIPIVPNVTINDGSSSVGADNDGSVQLLEAFCHSVITGEQPPKVVEESYFATMFSLLGDQATKDVTVLNFPEQYKIGYLNH